MIQRATAVLALALTLFAAACSRPTPTAAKQAAEPAAFPPIDAAAVLQHAKALSSNEFEGRFPGTRGEELTVSYIAAQFKRAGLRPGNSDGTYFQQVPLVGITPDPNTSLTLSRGSVTRTLRFRDDVVAWTKRAVPSVGIAGSEMVFVGYGVQAPEFDWDDYKGIDLKGKTMLVLIGDPAVPDPAHPGALDPRAFGGPAMTYYGRWTYKLEMAAKMGAAAVFIVHETGPAGYAFSVVQNKTGEQFDLATPDGNAGRPAVEGWLTREQAASVCAMAGFDFENLKRQAATRAFKPVKLGVRASMTLTNTLRRIDSRNVIGVIDGTDSALRSEYVVYTSHWDHFGVGREVNGDRVYHGAVDNAVAVGGLIEIARAFAAYPVHPRRSIVFLAVTAEEQLMLGSLFYTLHPVFPLERTVANINLEMLNVYGRTRDLTIVGLGMSDLDDYAQQAAAERGRVLKPDPEPDKGMYYRSDHFSFARAGVPALEPDAGVDFIDKPAGFGVEMRRKFIAERYHKPQDRVGPDWNLSGGAEDLQLYWIIGFRVAEADRWPEWKPGSEFKAARDRQLAAARQ